MNYEISAIIPVYNTDKKLLENAVQSILNDNVEILIVDDGSRGDVAEYIDTLESLYQNVVAYHVQNNGVANARNYGIRNANGRYIIFLDSDDTLDNSFFDYFKSLEDDYDLISFGFTKINKDKKFEKVYHYDGLISDINVYKKSLCDVDNGLALCWNKVYRKEFLLENNLFFNEGLVLAEDAEFILRVVDKAATIYNIPHSFYNYIIYKSSSSQTVNLMVSKNYVKSMNYIWNISGYSDKDKAHIVIDHLFFTIVKYSFKTQKNTKEQIQELKELLRQDCYIKAFKYINYHDFSLTKKIMIILIKTRLFLLLKLCVKVRG